jgi:hypothetical protein
MRRTFTHTELRIGLPTTKGQSRSQVSRSRLARDAEYREASSIEVGGTAARRVHEKVCRGRSRCFLLPAV